MVLIRSESIRYTTDGTFGDINKFQYHSIKNIRTLEKKKKIENNKDSILFNQTIIFENPPVF